MKNNIESLPFYKEILYYTGFFSGLTLILGIIFIYKNIFTKFQIPLIIIGGIFVCVTYFMWDTRCPKCKRSFVKNLINKEKIDEKIIPKTHYDKIEYLYSDGTSMYTKNGKAHIINHKIHTYKYYYNCKKCMHHWDNNKEIDLDKNTFQPKITKIKTKEKNPLSEIFNDDINRNDNSNHKNISKIKPLTQYETQKIILQRKTKCEYPHCKENITLDVHHIFPRGKGGTNKQSNLIVLCAIHHRQADRGSINATRLKMIVSKHIKNNKK